MPQTYVCFLWHMHQPFYKDLATGEYRLPWTRLHALKDYYGMVQLLSEFPEIHQTFNLVPSMVEQIQDYAASTASDPFLRLALKPAEQLSIDERAFIRQYFFQANIPQVVYRYPRYAQLYEQWQVESWGQWTAGDYRDLQVLSQVAWFDEVFLADDAEVRELVAKGRDYTLADQALMGRKQLEIIQRVVPVYREFARKGQIEISTTPYYHPILPLLCDSNIAGVYTVDDRQGAMHGGKRWVTRAYYGSDGECVYVRLDLVPSANLDGVTLNVRAQGALARVPLAAESFSNPMVEARRDKVLELRLPLAEFARLSLEVEQDGILRQRLPVQGEFEPGLTVAGTWGV